jgi:hypothetical protein
MQHGRLLCPVSLDIAPVLNRARSADWKSSHPIDERERKNNLHESRIKLSGGIFFASIFSSFHLFNNFDIYTISPTALQDFGHFHKGGLHMPGTPPPSLTILAPVFQCYAYNMGLGVANPKMLDIEN